jgi:hypothetical protein
MLLHLKLVLGNGLCGQPDQPRYACLVQRRK